MKNIFPLPKAIKGRVTFLPESKTFKTLFFVTALLTQFCMFARGQTSALPDYKMVFQFRNANGNMKDTILSRFQYKLWSDSGSYPVFVKWKNQPFAVLKSPLNGVGLFTDSSSSFITGQTVAYAFYKISTSGRFERDYLETNAGSFINDADTPNMEVIATPQGLILKAKQNIGPNTELTASYEAIIAMFPNDKSVRRAIQYW